MPQQVIVIPALGIVEFRNTVSKVIEEFGVEQYKNEEAEVHEGDLPASAVVGSRRTKVFYMDIGKNNRGVFCRMTEQSANFRQSLTVPDRYFREIGEWFLKAADQLEGRGGGDNNSSMNRQYNKQDGHNNHNNDRHDRFQRNDKRGERRARQVDTGLANRRDKDDDEYSE